MDYEKVKEQVKQLAEHVNVQVDKYVDGYKKELAVQQEQLDHISTQLKKGAAGGGFTMQKSFEDELMNGLEKSDQFTALKNKTSREANINLEHLKAADILTSTNITGDVIGATRVPGFKHSPERTEHIRELIPMGNTNSNTVEFYRESRLEDNTAMVAEGGLKPASDAALQAIRTTVKKIATSITVSEEIMDDLPALTSYITSRFSKKLLNLEDSQLLYGDGLGNNLRGITRDATPYTGGAFPAGSNLFDLLRRIVKQAKVTYYNPSAILLHPDDALTLSLLKDSQGRYLFPNLMNGQGMYVAGVPVIESTVMTPGFFLAGDFRLGAQIFQRKGIMVKIFDQHADYAQKNKLLFVIEERLALAVYQPQAFIYDSIADSLATI